MAPTGESRRGFINPRLARRVAVTRRYLAGAIAVGLASTACLVVQAVVLGRIVERVVLHRGTLAQSTSLVLALGVAFAGRAACGWVGELAAHRTSARVTSLLRRQLLTSAIARGPAWLSGERTGELAASATQGIESLDAYFARYLPTAVLAALTPLALLIWIGWTDWPSLVILGVTASVVPLFMVLLGHEAERHATAQWTRLSGLAATFFDLLQGLPTLRAFGRQEDGRRTLEATNEEFRSASMATLKVAFLSSFALEVLASIGTALVALFLGLRLLHGGVPLGTALAVLVLAPEVYLPLRRAGSEFHASAAGQAAAERILDILDDDPDAGDASGAVAVGNASGVVPDLRRDALVLSDVAVRYPGRALPVLEGIDLAIAPGEHVAVVGESGAGKSTLLAVLLGFAELTGGSVSAGGTDRRAVSPRAWRAQISWVPQRPSLVRGTIADNLRIGAPDATAAALRHAADVSGLSDLLARLPRGLDTHVGEGGLTLSAGERQRIALARAVLRDAPLVLLDEPASHLDTDREAELAETLSPWLEGRTLVIAAHRGAVGGRLDRTMALISGHLVPVTAGQVPSDRLTPHGGLR